MSRVLPGTSGSACRAVARQSIERTSSPRTYSRIESNSVPWPRMSSGVRPSSSRRRVSRDGRWTREWNGGSTRMRPGAASVACRDQRPSGPAERIVTCSVRRSPRRHGVSCRDDAAALARRDREPGAVGPATPAEGSQRVADGRAEHPRPEVLHGEHRRRRSRRAARGRAGRVRARPAAATPRATGRATPAPSDEQRASRRARATRHRRPTSPATTTGTTPSATRSANRPVVSDRHVRAAPAPAARSSAAPRRPRRPRARPRAAAARGAASTGSSIACTWSGVSDS